MEIERLKEEKNDNLRSNTAKKFTTTLDIEVIKKLKYKSIEIGAPVSAILELLVQEYIDKL